jgi:putative membrane protein
VCAKKRSEDYAKEKHLVLVFIAVLIWSAIDARDYFAWTMLTIPVIIYAGTLIATHKKFRFTYFTYVLVFIHIVILLIGAKYTYTHNPLFEEVKEIFNISRNHYDRVGHLAQGFVPAIVAREYLLRKGYFKKSKFFYVTIFAFVLAISAAWELLEFFAVVISNLPAKYVLSLQGDYLDTQKDMLLAFIGTALALVTLGKTHDKRIRDVEDN